MDPKIEATIKDMSVIIIAMKHKQDIMEDFIRVMSARVTVLENSGDMEKEIIDTVNDVNVIQGAIDDSVHSVIIADMMNKCKVPFISPDEFSQIYGDAMQRSIVGIMKNMEQSVNIAEKMSITAQKKKSHDMNYIG